MIWSRVSVPFLMLGALAAAQTLDFETYRSRVEPIFVKHREGHARCVSCHSAANNGFKLQPLADGATSYTEEQSKQNFAAVSKLVKAGDPTGSILLRHPLAHDAGGDEFHSGGRQFTSQSDPDWQAIADWVKGKK